MLFWILYGIALWIAIVILAVRVMRIVKKINQEQDKINNWEKYYVEDEDDEDESTTSGR